MCVFIWTKHNALSNEFCRATIQKFVNDPNRVQGRVVNKDVKDIKKSTDLYISEFSSWKKEDEILYKSLSDALLEYRKYLDEKLSLKKLETRGGGIQQINPYISEQIGDTGYQIQETLPNSFYDWHHDFYMQNENPRAITFIWYLNTINEGGYTEFFDGTKIQPEEGKIVLFPSTWTHYHRGYPPVNQKKYICTGWIHNEKAFKSDD